MFGKIKKIESNNEPQVKRPELGEIFKLPFGDKKVMNHWTKDSVYIEGIWGENISTFLTPYNKLTEAIEYGAVIPSKIRIICRNGKEFEGSYLELEQIAKEISNL